MIAELRDDPMHFSICADALLASGEPQGQVMSLHLQGLTDRGAELELEQLTRKIIGEPWFEEDHGVDLEWKRGFIDAIRWAGWHEFDRIERQYAELTRLLKTAAELVPSLPWRQDVSVTERVRAHRLLARLRTIHVGPWEPRPRHDRLWQLLAREGLPPSVKELIVADVPHPQRDEHQITWIDLGDLSQANAALQTLDRLFIRGSYLRLGRVDLPNLKDFTIFSSTFDELGALRSAKWPSLERLSIGFGDDEYNPTPTTVEDVSAFLREVPSKVTHLGLRNLAFTDELIPALASATVLKRLTELDLSFGVLLARGEELLSRHAEAFAHLKLLDVTDTGLTNFDELKLRIPGLHRGPEWRTKVDRYVSVSE
ncbi:MAG: hypothetical protein QM817_13435 [Archangium sp.]